VLGFQSLCSVISAAIFCQGSQIPCSHCQWRWYVCSSQHNGNKMCHNGMSNPWSQRTKFEDCEVIWWSTTDGTMTIQHTGHVTTHYMIYHLFDVYFK
jgi:hypothetical protein